MVKRASQVIGGGLEVGKAKKFRPGANGAKIVAMIRSGSKQF